MSNVTALETSLAKPPAWCEIRLSAIQSNLRKIQNIVGPSVGIMGVVKANAYGHGMVEVARALEEEVNYLAVASLVEAQALRQQKMTAPILVLGPTLAGEAALAAQLGVALTISNWNTAWEMEEILSKSGHVLTVHLKVDTGMGRLGVWPEHAFRLIQHLANSRHMVLEGLFTHFSSADSDDQSHTLNQITKFNEIVEQCKKNNIQFKWIHAANSAGIFQYASSHFNMVRPGISLYGVMPFSSSVQLEPALTLKTRMGLVKDFQKGQTVGYSRTYTVSRPERLAVLPIGYSSGYPWSLSGKSEVLIRNRRHPIVGRISMDSMMVDIFDAPFKNGEEVILLGGPREYCISATELAQKASTIPYEILTRLSPNLPRLFLP